MRNIRRLLLQKGMVNIFFASLRLGAFALKSSRLTASIPQVSTGFLWGEYPIART
jgi:hypothetical protein